MNRPHGRRYRTGIGRLFWLLALLLLVTACLPTSEDFASQSPLLAILERKVGRIVYVGADGNIYTVNQGGSGEQAITTDARLSDGGDADGDLKIYLFPAWSPDSQKVAFVGLRGAFDDPAEVTMHTAAADGSDPQEVYRNDVISPVYLYWSPDNQNLAFLSATPSGNMLLQMVPVNGGEAQVLDAGQPFYWSWSPNGQRLAIHVGGSESRTARLSFLSLHDQVIEEGLELRPTAFQSPAWSPDGSQLLLATRGETGDGELVLTDGNGRIQESLVDLGQRAVGFAWSPDGKRIAYIVSASDQPQTLLGRLTALNMDDRDQTASSAEGSQVIGFFWSPDSEKLAYFVPRRIADEDGQQASEGQALALELHVLDVETGLSKQITVFQPTPQFLNVLPFFDQYHRSATIWSPDSKNVVVGAISSERAPEIWVVNTSGELNPRPIARGLLAFWSWE